MYPALHPLEDIGPLWSGDGAGDMRRGKAVDVAPEVSSVRDYDSTDGLSRIHWASTARTGRLMSRTYDTRYSADLLVILDLRAGVHAGQAPESSLEYAVSIAASIVNAVARRGQAVGLITNDADMRAFGAGRGEAQRMRLLDYLATARDNGSAPLAHVVSRHGEGWRGRGGMVVVSGDRDSALGRGARRLRHARPAPPRGAARDLVVRRRRAADAHPRRLAAGAGLVAGAPRRRARQRREGARRRGLTMSVATATIGARPLSLRGVRRARCW